MKIEKAICKSCGIALRGITGFRECSDGFRCDDCYFKELGELIERYPICSLVAARAKMAPMENDNATSPPADPPPAPAAPAAPAASVVTVPGTATLKISVEVIGLPKDAEELAQAVMTAMKALAPLMPTPKG